MTVDLGLELDLDFENVCMDGPACFVCCFYFNFSYENINVLQQARESFALLQTSHLKLTAVKLFFISGPITRAGRGRFEVFAWRLHTLDWNTRSQETGAVLLAHLSSPAGSCTKSVCLKETCACVRVYWNSLR